jgi:biopolymer transport protein ExbD
MIARPLELASRLRPPPRNFDAWFYVNAGLLALFFMLCGSRFVLAPGLGMDFKLPRLAGSGASAAPATDHISVLGSGQIYGDQGLLDLPQLRAWLKAVRIQRERAKMPHPTLLVLADAQVRMDLISEIFSAAHEAGFQVIFAAQEPGGPAAEGR